MLKKAGIYAAVAAAGLMAVSPIAFAGDYSGDHHGHGGHHHHHGHGGHHGHHARNASCELDNGTHNGNNNRQVGGLIALQNTNVSVPVQACNDSIIEGALGILAKGQNNHDNHG